MPASWSWLRKERERTEAGQKQKEGQELASNDRGRKMNVSNRQTTITLGCEEPIPQ